MMCAVWWKRLLKLYVGETNHVEVREAVANKRGSYLGRAHLIVVGRFSTAADGANGNGVDTLNITICSTGVSYVPSIPSCPDVYSTFSTSSLLVWMRITAKENTVIKAKFMNQYWMQCPNAIMVAMNGV